jgi:hypothetical protein
MEHTASVFAARALGVASDDEGRDLDVHVASCEGCRELVSGLGAALEADPISTERAPDVWSRIEASVDRLEGKGPVVVLACTYCKDKLERPTAVFCAGCLAPHHDECWKEHGRCAACRETRFVHPSAAPRKRAATVVAALCALGISGGIAAVAGRAPARVPGPPRMEGPYVPQSPGSPEVVDEIAPKVHIGKSETLGGVIAQLNQLSVRKDIFSNAPGTPLSFSSDGKSWDETENVLAAAVGGTLVQDGGTIDFIDVEPRVTMSFEEERVQDVLRKLCERYGKQLVLSTYARFFDHRVSLDLHDVRWNEALLSVARSGGLSLRFHGDIVVAGEKPAPWGHGDLAAAERACWKTAVATDGVSLVASRVVPTAHSTIVARGATAGTLARLLATMEGRSVIVPSECATTSLPTFRLEDVPWTDALAAALCAEGLGLCTEKGSETCLRVTTRREDASAEIPRIEAPGLERAVNHQATFLWPTSLELTAVAIDHDRRISPHAVIGTIIVTTGNGISGSSDGYEVASITETGVDFVRNETGSRYSLLLGANELVRAKIPAPDLTADEIAATTARHRLLLAQAAAPGEAGDAAMLAELFRLHDRLDRAGLLKKAETEAEGVTYLSVVANLAMEKDPKSVYLRDDVQLERVEQDLAEAERARDTIAQDALEDGRLILDKHPFTNRSADAAHRLRERLREVERALNEPVAPSMPTVPPGNAK